MHGVPEANRLVLECDILLAVGTRFSDRTTGRFDEFCTLSKIIHVDVDPSEIGKNKRVDLPIVGDAKITLAEIYKAIVKKAVSKDRSVWLSRVEEVRRELAEALRDEGGEELTGPKVVKKVREVLPPKCIVCTEVGQNQMWAQLHFKVLEPRGWVSSAGLGTMGFGFPASLGAKVARPDLPVLDLAGDGSFQMTMNSLAVSIEEDIPVIVVIFNNRSLGMVEQWQRLFYNRRYSEVKLGATPDFVKLAEAYGAHGIRAGSLQELEEALKEALRSEVTTVIDVPMSSEQDVFPFVPPGKGLKDMMLGPGG